jgi:hypothetical protein
MRMKAALALLAGTTCAACLPVDDRPPPGVLTVNLESDDSLGPERAPFTTDDGWSISYSSFVMSIGYTQLGESDACSDYGSAFGPGRGYNRLIELNSAEVQRISEVRLIGTCSLGFWNRDPEDDSVLGEGVTEDMRALLLAKEDDQYTSGLGTTLYVKGEATRGEQTKTFEWFFRQAIRHIDCEVETDAGIERGIQLEGEEERSYELFVRGKSLFSSTFQGEALEFAPFTSADDEYGNGDGEITLEELDLVPLGLGRLDRAIATPANLTSFGGYVYMALVSDLVRFRTTGTCQVEQAFTEETERALRRRD